MIRVTNFDVAEVGPNLKYIYEVKTFFLGTNIPIVDKNWDKSTWDACHKVGL